jgi:hypothetical protein
MRTCSPNDVSDTHGTEAVMIVKDVASVLKGPTQRCLKAPYAMLVSQSAFECRATSSSMTTKLTPVSGWKTTASHVEKAE